MHRNRNFINHLTITLKGMAMGAADVVPGVSGGTIAFISGIYEELLDSINAVNFSLLKVIKKDGIKKAWQLVNGNFLVALILGIGISVVSLAKSLSWLLENNPIPLWAFFFGLVVASILLVAKQIPKWNIKIVLALLIGAIVAFLITQIPASSVSEPSMFLLLLSGALAISAMILPGISGAFILVILGTYKFILTAVHERDLKTILIVGIGAIIGLLSISRLLKYIFTHYKNLTLAVLTGFIIGALGKIWPWKDALENNISPSNYTGNNQIVLAIFLAIAGFLLITILEKWGQKMK